MNSSIPALVCMSWQWLDKLRLVNPPIEDTNAHVCSHHYKDEDYVKPVLEGFEPTQPTLKDHAVPTVFSFSTPAKM